MGAFIVNIQVRNEDHQALANHLGESSVEAAWVLPAKNGWSTVVEEQASNQDDRRIRELTGGLSKSSDAPAIAFLVHDSDFVCYWLFDKGKQLDEFNSCPDYFEDGGSGEASASGQPDVLLKYCKPGTTVEDVESVLQAESTFAEEQLEALASLLGIADSRATLDFRDMTAGKAKKANAIALGDSSKKSVPSKSAAILKFPGVASADDSNGNDDEENDGDDDDLDFDIAAADSPFDRESLMKNLQNLSGLFGQKVEHDPVAAELVEAAFAGDIANIERLVAGGAKVDGAGPLVPKSQVSEPRHPMLAGMSVVVSPIFAAVAGKQIAALDRLIALGADVNAVHPMLG